MPMFTLLLATGRPQFIVSTWVRLHHRNFSAGFFERGLLAATEAPASPSHPHFSCYGVLGLTGHLSVHRLSGLMSIERSLVAAQAQYSSCHGTCGAVLLRTNAFSTLP